MDGGGGKIEEPAEPAAPAVPTKRAPGRPKGTTYRTIDQPLHEEMRLLVERGAVPSITAAAAVLAWRAFPPTSTRKARAKRLAATYPWPAANNISGLFGNSSQATTPRDAAQTGSTHAQRGSDRKMHDNAAGDTSGTPRATRSRILRIDTKSPYVGKVCPPQQFPDCDRMAHYSWKGKLFDAHGREIVPGQPLAPEDADPSRGAGEIVEPALEAMPASQLLARINELPLTTVRSLAEKLLGEGEVHRTKQQISSQLHDFITRSKVRRAPNATRLARAAAARAETPVERVEVEDFPDA